MGAPVFDQEIHVGDIGTTLEITIIDPVTKRPLNIQDATEVMVFLQPPPVDEETPSDRLDKVGSLVSDGRDGRVKYVTILGDLSLKGTWQLQVRVTTPDGVWHSQIIKFKVEGNL